MEENSQGQKHTDGSFHDAGESPTMKNKMGIGNPVLSNTKFTTHPYQFGWKGILGLKSSWKVE